MHVSQVQLASLLCFSFLLCLLHFIALYVVLDIVVRLPLELTEVKRRTHLFVFPRASKIRRTYFHMKYHKH
jgi:hypothetical protein